MERNQRIPQREGIIKRMHILRSNHKPNTRASATTKIQWTKHREKPRLDMQKLQLQKRLKKTIRALRRPSRCRSSQIRRATHCRRQIPKIRLRIPKRKQPLGNHRRPIKQRHLSKMRHETTMHKTRHRRQTVTFLHRRHANPML